MTSYRVERAGDLNELARIASQSIATYIDLALKERERAQVSLSGGSTPYKTYTLLGKQHIPWERVDILLGDERWVDSNDNASNAGMISRTILSTKPSSCSRFHPIPTTQLPNPQASAEAFSEILSKVCLGDPPIFDLILLGLGDDGHTASLFPGSDSLSVTKQWVVSTRAKGHDRITLTAQVLSAARKVVFLVSGASKQIALQRLLDPSESPSRTPAKLVRPKSEILVLADEAASELI